MKRIFHILIIVICISGARAQGIMEIPLSVPDSLKMTLPANPGTLLSLPVLSGIPAFSVLGEVTLHPPAFDINKYLGNQRLMTKYSEYRGTVSGPGWLSAGLFSPFLPFHHSAAIFNQAAYQIGDKVVVGGNSFGINSILSSPLPHPFENQWERRGASMFMQYNVNRNFRIETRISVTGNHFHP